MFLNSASSIPPMVAGSGEIESGPRHKRTAEVISQAWGRWRRLGAKTNEAEDLMARVTTWAKEIAKATHPGNTTACNNILVAVRHVCEQAITEGWEFDRLLARVKADLKAYGVYI